MRGDFAEFGGAALRGGAFCLRPCRCLRVERALSRAAWACGATRRLCRVHALTFALTLAAQVHRLAPEQRIGFLPACMMMFREWLAFFALFAIVQPFGGSFSLIRRAGTVTIRLSCSFMATDAIRRLVVAHGGVRSAGFATEINGLSRRWPVSTAMPSSFIVRSKRAFDETGAGKVRLVTHSMGGLVARAYLKRYGSARVDRAITLACVHHGTRLARLGFGLDPRRMEPGSAWLSTLPDRLPVPTVNVWMAQDNFISPQTSSRLSGAEDITLSGMGHLTIAFSPLVADLLVKKLRSF